MWATPPSIRMAHNTKHETTMATILYWMQPNRVCLSVRTLSFSHWFATAPPPCSATRRSSSVYCLSFMWFVFVYVGMVRMEWACVYKRLRYRSLYITGAATTNVVDACFVYEMCLCARVCGWVDAALSVFMLATDGNDFLYIFVLAFPTVVCLCVSVYVEYMRTAYTFVLLEPRNVCFNNFIRFSTMTCRVKCSCCTSQLEFPIRFRLFRYLHLAVWQKQNQKKREKKIVPPSPARILFARWQ